MAMTKRERVLAIGVGVVFSLFGTQYALNSVTNRLQLKQDLVAKARGESDDMTKLATSGQIAARKIEELNSKSLPTNQETLVAQYRSWLVSLGEEVGMDDIKVTVPERPIRTTDAYAKYNFTLRGFCGTDQLVELLGKFYDKNYLHTVRSLKLAMTPQPNVFSVQLDSQALSLRGALPKQEPSAEPSGRLSMAIDEYKRIILQRNPFSPPNKPPRIATGPTHEIQRGSQWSLALEAKDPEDHPVSFELVSTELPEGLQFQQGELNWRPDKNGEYEVVVKASDSGWPGMSSERKLTLKVVDPPVEKPKEEPPKFDVAKQAFVSAILSGRSGPEACIRSRIDGETLYLTEGSDFTLGTVKAKVVSINLKEDFVELESDGARWTIGMDISLADAFKNSQVD